MVLPHGRKRVCNGQTTENQRRHRDEVAQRLGWTVVAVFSDEDISRIKSRDHRPGFDALSKRPS